ncbi:surface protease GP63 [Trypanosoma grayi]|uniref:surface protease GP63 n=1 Tax=Trypanosoma grayi TaxID=71804 RepID=UPI0004F3F227|nr:surface protease GP63 [Trypanosoma grayi]KEG07012.1 surface protease GP63 [Trypanosoma grayi]
MLRCEEEDVLTRVKVVTLARVLLPEAIKLHTDRLLVQPVTGAMKFPKLTKGICSHFTVPSSHRTEGVSGADMVLYVAAGPTEDSVVAWASACVELPDGRPVVGVINFSPRFIGGEREIVRSVSHEIAHALGFGYEMIERKGMITNVSGIRGKNNTFVVSSERTRAKAREHYGCNTLAGMELEDEGDAETAHSHWERRNAKDELMSPIVGVGYYTALTMSAFEDMGVYRAQWGMEEPMSWGHKAGCSLLDDKCLTDGVTSHPDMFCRKQTDALSCTSDRRALGHCPIVEYADPLPFEFQYFTEPNVGGKEDLLMNFCPVIVPFLNSDCANGEPSVMVGSRIGPKSACLKSVALRMDGQRIGDVCAEVLCGDGAVYVRYLGNDTWHLCPEGAHITPGTPFTRGRILCPRRMDVCPPVLTRIREETRLDTDNSFGSDERDSGQKAALRWTRGYGIDANDKRTHVPNNISRPDTAIVAAALFASTSFVVIISVMVVLG